MTNNKLKSQIMDCVSQPYVPASLHDRLDIMRALRYRIATLVVSNQTDRTYATAVPCIIFSALAAEFTMMSEITLSFDHRIREYYAVE